MPSSSPWANSGINVEKLANKSFALESPPFTGINRSILYS
ncbi:hypothetical protein THTE_4275 [Thermogutta terrifontis]|uniref:Uncharacterized protein n=1 Tax=Thermogutta terrifontis TaxID=1331910 RepID=A0A286RLP1_9BACT|nr:hypothetical protein THTE_4275 [Thermogutta terrifontis]